MGLSHPSCSKLNINGGQGGFIYDNRNANGQKTQYQIKR